MENKNLQDNDIRQAVEIIKKGGVILYPTDTIWGLGCDARNQEAVKRVFQIKRRLDSKAMLVLVNNEAALERLVDDIPDINWELLEVAENPLTIIYDNAHGVDPQLIAEDGSLGIRIPKDKFVADLCKKAGTPLVSTSANISGQKAPACFKDISEEIKTQVDYIMISRREDNAPKKPSNIIKLSKGGVIKVIR